MNVSRHLPFVPAVQTKPLKTVDDLQIDVHYLLIGGIRWNYIDGKDGVVFVFENEVCKDLKLCTLLDEKRHFSKAEVTEFINLGMLYMDMPVNVLFQQKEGLGFR